MSETALSPLKRALVAIDDLQARSGRGRAGASRGRCGHRTVVPASRRRIAGSVLDPAEEGSRRHPPRAVRPLGRRDTSSTRIPMRQASSTRVRAASSTVWTASIRSCLACRRARPSTWIPSSGCSSKWPGRHSSGRGRRPTASMGCKPACSSAFAAMTTRGSYLERTGVPNHPLLGVGNRAQRGLRTPGIRAGPARPGGFNRHGLLLVARRAAPGVSEPARWRLRDGARGGRASHARARQHDRVLQVAHDVARGPLQDVRRGRRRVRPGRGLRRAGAQAPRRRDTRRRSRLGRHPRDGGQPGRGERRADGPERTCAGSRCPRRARGRRTAARRRRATSRRTGRAPRSAIR